LDGMLYLAGADGAMVVEHELQTTDHSVGILVRGSNMHHVRGLLGLSFDHVVSISDEGPPPTPLIFSCEAWTIAVGIETGSYPDYREVLQSDKPLCMTSADMLLRNCKDAIGILGSTPPVGVFDVSSLNGATLSLKNSALRCAATVFDTHHQSYDLGRLQEIMQVFGGQTVAIQTRKNFYGLVVLGHGARAAVMPVTIP